MAAKRERGFTLVEILIATAIAGVLFATLAQFLLIWGKATAKAALKARTARVETDLRRLADAVRSRYTEYNGFPAAGPWPAQVPTNGPLPWVRPAPGFDDLGWAPERSPVDLQYKVDGWGTGFVVSAVGAIARDGQLVVFRVWGDVNMFEGPLPFP